MFTYVLRRVLLMVPTLVGISLIVWIVMTAAPGRPGSQSSALGDTSTSADPSKERAKGESQRIFRRHFALDRPVFWNSWTSLGEDEVAAAIERSDAAPGSLPMREKREAKERLEDWGSYAVPALVRLLESRGDDPARQDRVLYWLRFSAVRIPEHSGKTPDAATLARTQEMLAENAKISGPDYAWKASDPPERRREVVGRWKTWYSERKERWTWSAWETWKVRLGDTQFANYWSKLLRLDFGMSHYYRRPALQVIVERLPVTITLSAVSLLLAYVLAIPLGIWSAVKPYTLSDRTISVGLFLLYSLPSFFVGTVLLRLFTVGEPFAWFPNSGFSAVGADRWNTWDRIRDVVWHITLPLVTMTYGGLAALSRYARTGMLDVIRSDYVRTARAKGLSEGAVVLRHAARNGMMPVVTLLGGALPALVGGAVTVEYIFNIQGVGTLMLDAIHNKDFNVVMAETLIVAVLTMIGLLLADLGYAVLDPRISYS